MLYHVIAFVAGFLLDLIFGDPEELPHPVRYIGKWISFLEGKLLKEDAEEKKKRRSGLLLVLLVVIPAGVLPFLVLFVLYRFIPVAGCIVESYLTFQLLAARSLRTESMKVYFRLRYGKLEEARKAVSMIVGRDTDSLNRSQVIKATVETIAENTSDGEIAPLIYMAIGGPILGLMYKSINTMDSMVGYKNEKYIDFGRCAAKLDDVVNFVPARISAVFMIFACNFLGEEFSARNASRIFIRDRKNHASPNSAQTESVCAGALGIRLGGPSSYFGTVVEKPFIGDFTRRPEPKDIVRANELMYGASVTGFVFCLMILSTIFAATLL